MIPDNGSRKRETVTVKLEDNYGTQWKSEAASA